MTAFHQLEQKLKLLKLGGMLTTIEAAHPTRPRIATWATSTSWSCCSKTRSSAARITA